MWRILEWVGHIGRMRVSTFNCMLLRIFYPRELKARGIQGRCRFPEATGPIAFDQYWSNFRDSIQQNDLIDFQTNWFVGNLATTHGAAISINVNIYILTDQILGMIFRVSGVTCKSFYLDI